MPDLPYRPEVPTTQTVQFRTDVMKAFDGTEHRMALLAKPRQALDYSVLLDDDEVRQLRADLFNDLEATWRVPLWHEPFLITADVAAGASSADAALGNSDIIADLPVVWEDAVYVTADGNDLEKTGGGAAWNGGAVSVATVHGSGYVEFGVNQWPASAICGFSNGDTDQSYGDIDFGLMARGTGNYEVYEGGSQKYVGTTYAVTDRFRVRVDGTTVTYWYQSGGVGAWTKFYTSATAATFPLLVDTSIFTVGSILTDVLLCDDISDTYVYLDREDGTEGEFVEVWATTDDTVSFDGVTTAAFPAGSYVYPVASGFLSEGQGYARQAVELTEFPLKLTVTDIQALGGSGASITTYEGLPLLDRRPLADSPVDESFRKRIERIDFGAEVAQITGLDYANIGGGRRFIINDRDELQYFKLFLDTVIGMREPFYVPTWRNDLVYQASPSPGGTTILIETAPSYLTEWHPSDSHRDLQFETTEGTFQRRVASVVDNYDGSHTVTLTSAMPSGAWTVDVISFVERSRLGSDTITLSHFGQSSVVDMAIVTIPEPVPQAVVWGTLVNLTAIYNDLEKTSGDTWAYDAYTVSDQQIPTSNCYFEFASDTHAAYQRRGGLSLAGTDISGGAIEFAIQLNGTQIRVYENGVYATTAATTFTAGDVLRVQVTCNGEVTYWHNGVLFHSSLSAPATFPLEAGVAFYTVGGTITDPVIGEL